MLAPLDCTRRFSRETRSSSGPAYSPNSPWPRYSYEHTAHRLVSRTVRASHPLSARVRTRRNSPAPGASPDLALTPPIPPLPSRSRANLKRTATPARSHSDARSDRPHRAQPRRSRRNPHPAHPPPPPRRSPRARSSAPPRARPCARATPVAVDRPNPRADSTRRASATRVGDCRPAVATSAPG